MFAFPLDVQFLRLLCSMRVISTSVHFQLAVHSTAQRAFWQHAFNRELNSTLRESLHHLLEVSFLQTTREARVTVVHFVGALVTSNVYFLSVNDNDVITSINVRGV